MSLPVGVHLTTGQPDQSSNTLGHQILCLGEGQVDILLDSQSASNVHKCQPVILLVGHIVGGGRTGGLTTLGPSPGS